MTTHRTATAALAVGVGLLPACSSIAPAGSAPAPAAASPAARDISAACAAQLRVASTIPQGADPDAPPPAAQEMKAWAAAVAPDFAVVAANAPDSLRDSLAVLRTQLEQAKRGRRIDVTDPAGNKASDAVDRWVHDSCGYQTLDVVVNNGVFGAIPQTLQPGPVAVEFTNSGDPSTAGFVLLVGRVKDGQAVKLDDLSSGKADVEQATDIVTAALPTDGGSAYTSATLRPGRYILASPLGMPPNFGRTLYAALTVQ